MVTFVLIPGLLSDARVWRPLAEALSERGDVVEAESTGSSTIEELAASALARVDGAVVPVGHSMGGRVALEMAHQAPGRVVGVVAADTGHDGLQERERPVREQRIAQGHEDFAALVDAWLPPMVAPSRHGTALYRSLHEMALAAGPQVHERQIRALMSRPVATDYLPDLAMPVLLLTGTEDGWAPPAQHDELARLLPDAELVVVEGAGHFLPVETPQECADAVLDWLDRRLPA